MSRTLSGGEMQAERAWSGGSELLGLVRGPASPNIRVKCLSVASGEREA